MASDTANDRIVFANQLRGLAAFSVLFSHYTGAFWGRPDEVGKTLGLPAQVYADPPQGLIWFGDLPFFNAGPFGVALFFLISGFVIPISLERLGPLPFLVARFLRIWPTYVAGFGLAVALLACWHALNGTAFPYSAGLVLAQSAIVLRDWLWLPVVDGIVWTLEVEMKFYFAMALLFWLAGGFRLPHFAAIAIAGSLVSIGFGLGYDWLLAEHVWWFKRLAIVSITASFFPYMFIGTGFYLLYRGRITGRELVLFSALMLAASAASWRIGFLGIGPVVASMASCGFALALFAACYALRSRFRPNRVFDFLADISYPLYVTHYLIGLLAMYLLVEAGFSPWPVMLLAFLLAFLIAWALHRMVEKPTQRAGRRLGVWLAERRRPIVIPAQPAAGP